jgi:hypothetical protein
MRFQAVALQQLADWGNQTSMNKKGGVGSASADTDFIPSFFMCQSQVQEPKFLVVS